MDQLLLLLRSLALDHRIALITQDHLTALSVFRLLPTLAQQLLLRALSGAPVPLPAAPLPPSESTLLDAFKFLEEVGVFYNGSLREEVAEVLRAALGKRVEAGREWDGDELDEVQAESDEVQAESDEAQAESDEAWERVLQPLVAPEEGGPLGVLGALEAAGLRGAEGAPTAAGHRFVLSPRPTQLSVLIGALVRHHGAPLLALVLQAVWLRPGQRIGVPSGGRGGLEVLADLLVLRVHVGEGGVERGPLLRPGSAPVRIVLESNLLVRLLLPPPSSQPPGLPVGPPLVSQCLAECLVVVPPAPPPALPPCGST